MNGNTSLRLRALLLKHPEGLTIDVISRTLQREYTNVAKRLHATYGCYVLRWEDRRQIWACVPVPPNAIKPPHVKAVKAKPVKAQSVKASVRAASAEPLTQSVLDAQPEPYKPQKTVWQYVKPWPKEPE